MGGTSSRAARRDSSFRTLCVREGERARGGSLSPKGAPRSRGRVFIGSTSRGRAPNIFFCRSVLRVAHRPHRVGRPDEDGVAQGAVLPHVLRQLLPASPLHVAEHPCVRSGSHGAGPRRGVRSSGRRYARSERTTTARPPARARGAPPRSRHTGPGGGSPGGWAAAPPFRPAGAEAPPAGPEAPPGAVPAQPRRHPPRARTRPPATAPPPRPANPPAHPHVPFRPAGRGALCPGWQPSGPRV